MENKPKKEMQIARLEHNELHELFMKCFGSVANSARVLGYTDTPCIYLVINDSTKRLNKKKFLAGKKQHLKNIDKLTKKLGFD